jgi:hypothetical protein
MQIAEKVGSLETMSTSFMKWYEAMTLVPGA